MKFVVEGRALEKIANEITPKLDELAEKYGFLETLSATVLVAALHLGKENVQAALEGINLESYSIVPRSE